MGRPKLDAPKLPEGQFYRVEFYSSLGQNRFVAAVYQRRKYLWPKRISDRCSANSIISPSLSMKELASKAANEAWTDIFLKKRRREDIKQAWELVGDYEVH